MHRDTHSINSPKLESNARFLKVHKGYLKEIILSHETTHQRNNRTSGRKRLYDPLPGIKDDSWNFPRIAKSTKNNKHLMTGTEGNSEFCFPRISIEIRGKQNSMFPKGPVIK